MVGVVKSLFLQPNSALGQTETRRKVVHMSAVHLNAENYIVKSDIIIAKQSPLL
jgi:hypothetical protein